jgi:hypothetical protein
LVIEGGTIGMREPAFVPRMVIRRAGKPLIRRVE